MKIIRRVPWHSLPRSSESMILADVAQPVLRAVGIEATRVQALVSVTVAVLLPLCLQEDLRTLAPFSFLGNLGMLYTAGAMAMRYMGGDYAPGGRFLDDVPEALRPRFGNRGAVNALRGDGDRRGGALALINMLSTAFLAHYVAPRICSSSPPSSSDSSDRASSSSLVVVRASFFSAAAYLSAVSALGFLTFGSACSGFVLDNYSPRDRLMVAARLTVVVGVAFQYPLCFAGARDGALDLLLQWRGVPRSEEKRTDGDSDSLALNRFITLALLGAVTLAAAALADPSVLLSLSGATLGVALIYIYPAFVLRSVARGKGEKAARGDRVRCAFAVFLAAMGVAVGCLGTMLALGGLAED
mmetsp:Transcript_63472/g.187415  ORF Transcript_63472/g.187415 Transcript_63472/m.187415 type:complete len:357 (-) Transcript_63472:321-1391(-)